ncbi:hypothetical protein [Lysinibacillus xylanilyticus]|uniref:hypothetical protein n=1 Tax=Lysinibacillus xylanilyticus TaxID=582475 RepID=UPI000ABDBDBA|nr:hypothetical protein [Lysinibacillus xylanilyticus]
MRRKKHLPLPLCFRAEKNICRCRFAFAQKTFAAAALLSLQKTIVAVATITFE